MRFLHGPICQEAVETRVAHLGEHARHRGAPRDAERDDVVAAQGHDARVEAHEPIDHLPNVASARQPEPGQLDGRPLAELARPLARRRGGDEPRG